MSRRQIHRAVQRIQDAVVLGATAWQQGRSARPKSVILHPGFRKTGTSTVQNMLARNEAVLRNHVRKISAKTDPSSLKLRRAAYGYVARPSPSAKRRVRRAARELNWAVASVQQATVIISDENIIGHSVMAGGRDLFVNAADILAIVEEELAHHELQLVFTTREREAWMRSCHNQDVKQHKFTGDFADWLEIHGGCRQWSDGLELLQANLKSPVRFVPMETELVEGRFLGQCLLEVADVPPDLLRRLTVPPPQNRSLDAVQIELIREINQLDLSFGQIRAVVDVIRRRQDLLRSPKGR